MQPDPHTMLELIGLRPVVVEDLGRRSVLVRKYRVLLVDAQVSSRELDDVVDGILARAAADLANER